MRLVKRWWPEALVVLGAYSVAGGLAGVLLAVGALAIVERFRKRLMAIESNMDQLRRTVDSIDSAIPNRDVHGNIIPNG